MCPSLRPYLSQRHGEGRFRLPEALALGRPGGQPFTSTSIRHGKASIHGVKSGRSGSDSGFNLHGSFNKRGFFKQKFNVSFFENTCYAIFCTPTHGSQYGWGKSATICFLFTISVGVRILFTGILFQGRSGKNMSFSP